MSSDYSDIALQDILKNGKYDASIILTFNAFLPFYEEVVLRALQSGGCRNNVLLMDARQLHESLNTPSMRPRLAGFEYTLLPIKAARAFHPKIIFLVGEKKGCILVGSHNVTISGFRQNLEITSKIQFGSLKDKASVAYAIQVWQFIKDWIDQQRDYIPEELLESVYRLPYLAPWLRDRVEAQDGEVQFFGTQAEGVSLYDQVFSRVSGDIERISIVGPFFDNRLAVIKALSKRFSPSEFFVGIDPNTVVISNHSDQLSGINFVNAADFGPKTTYLHAKIIYIESKSGEHWLVTGSANPSDPAWIAGPDARNAEAVVLHTGKIAELTAGNLGVVKLKNCKIISADEWLEIEQRTTHTSDSDFETSKLIIATVGEDKIVLPEVDFAIDDFIQAEVYGENAELTAVVEKAMAVRDGIAIPVSGMDVRYIRSIKITLSGGRYIFTWVHHTIELSRRSESSRQAKFRAAMSTLESDDPDLSNLINIVGNVIFDERQDVDPKALRESRPKEKEGGPEGHRIIDLEADIPERKFKNNNRRMVNSGDLGLVMDALIYNLGFGLRPVKGPGGYTKGRDEEDMIGAADDDDDTNDNIGGLGDPELIKICHAKVRNIVNRMRSQFALAQKRKGKYYIPVVQLVAVMALFRQLRKIEKRDGAIPPGETLVPEKERERLLSGVLPYLYGKDFQFVNKAEEELIDEPIDEISKLKGLLLWLAKDCGIDIRSSGHVQLGIDYDKLREDAISKAKILVLAPLAASDADALYEAEKSIKETATDLDTALDWFNTHRYWGIKFLKYVQELKRKKISKNKQPKIGDMVFLNSTGYDFFNIVYSISEYTNSVKLAGIEGKEGIREYLKSNLIFFKLPSVEKY